MVKLARISSARMTRASISTDLPTIQGIPVPEERTIPGMHDSSELNR